MEEGIGSEFAVCSVRGGCCVGVSRGETQEELIVTFRTGAIQVFNVHDLKVVCSWQLPSSQELICGAINHPNKQRYWVITTNQNVLEWSREDKTVETSHAVRPRAAKLLSIASELVPLVVYSTGEVDYLSRREMPSCWLAPKAKKWKLVLAEVCCDQYICLVGVEKQVTVGIAKFMEGRLAPPIVNTLKFKGKEFLSSCICGDKLLLLLTTGQLWMVNVGHPLLPLCVTSTFPSATPSTCLLALSCENFVHIDSKSLELWEACYFTRQQFLEAIVPPGAKCWCVEGRVYIWTNEGQMKGWRIESSKSTLAQALGKLSSSSNSPPTILSGWPQSQKELKEFGAPAQSVEYVEALLDKTKTPTLEDFSSVFHSKPLTPELCYSDVIERLLHEEQFWGTEALSALHRAGLVPGNLDVLGVIVEKEDWGLACVCLDYGPPPSEQCIVKALGKALSLPEGFECVGDGGIPVSKQQLLCKVIRQPFSEAFMQSPCANMPFHVVKSLLGFLSDQVSIAALLTADFDTSVPYHTILDWIALLLNVHFTRLMLDHQLRQLWVSLQSKITAQVTCYSRLSSLN